MPTTVLIVDDDRNVGRSVSMVLARRGMEACCAAPPDWSSALTEDVDVVLLDLYLGSIKGRNVLERLLAEQPLVPVIIMSGVATAEEAVDCVRRGAFDYLEKPLTAERLAITVANAARYRQARLAALADTVPVFASQSMRALAEDCRKVAVTDAAVLITGESGTGKEVTARYIHGLSRRSAQPLVKVDCGALPESLIESELFGHAKGAFTGAHADYPGKLRAAAGGTLFLDEVAELPPGAQTRLLRFLDAGEVQRIGSTAVTTIDTRIIAATNVDLEQAVSAGTLRRDLYFRLNVIRLQIPPLRSRREDIVPLAESFVTSLAARLGVEPRVLSRDAHGPLRALSLPGNVRELKTIIERVLVLGDAPVIQAADIEHAAAGGVVEADDPFAQTMPLAEAKRVLERRYLQRQLELHGRSVKRTAAALGILPNNLSRRVRQLETGDTEHADSE